VLEYLLGADPSLAHAALADGIGPLTEIFAARGQEDRNRRAQIAAAEAVNALHSARGRNAPECSSASSDDVVEAVEAAAALDAERRRQAVLRERHASRVEGLGSTAQTRPRLYLPCVVNGCATQALVDTGAEFCMMTREEVERCGLADRVDTSVTGRCSGMGSAAIIGQVHRVVLTLRGRAGPTAGSPGGRSSHAPPPTPARLPLSLYVVDHAMGSPFLIGLNLLWRHGATIDLAAQTCSLYLRARGGAPWGADAPKVSVPLEVRRAALEVVRGDGSTGEGEGSAAT
jgi:hypothetical protein